ncbi:MAG: hypothetical protein OEV46_07570 [Betaproteobacteria bacterium]|jgi:hypothetical protein|nr:hypothetical protein [Betaproteobacteria bacterium]MDH5287097.1 hypothetical protein [Betaproteobacteria bacterium]
MAALLVAAPALAGPIEVTLDGPRFCPRDRPAGAKPLTATVAMARARELLPDGFCGPSREVDGCDVDAEEIDGTFRVYAHQYKLRGGRHDWTLLAHTYVILDSAGNCLAHIPGTEGFGRP